MASSIDNSRRSFIKWTLGSITSLFVLNILGLSWIIKNARALDGAVEVDISDMRPGESKSVIWLGDPVFIRRRTKYEIDSVRNASEMKCRKCEDDALRTKNPEWIVLIGVCTHLGCIPISDSQGWTCPCHNSKFDCSGRVVSGPARKNLAVPPYKFIGEGKILIGQD